MYASILKLYWYGVASNENFQIKYQEYYALIQKECSKIKKLYYEPKA
jgi:hypothetical protein